MSRQATVFPGQGVQRPGMGVDFYEAFDIARRVFQRAREALPFDVLAVCRDNDPRLDLTEFTQPCILTTEVAMLEVLRQEFGWAPRFFGGHSLGEYTALVAAGVLPLETALALVHLRGRLMQQAVPPGRGAMAALTMQDLPVRMIAERAADHDIDIANYNSPAQVVLSGEVEALERLIAALSAELGSELRVTRLAVSAPFHSRLMEGVYGPFRDALEQAGSTFRPEFAESVASNYAGGMHQPSTDAIIDSLARQITGSVRWLNNMRVLAGSAHDIVEVGPNRPLTGFFRAIEVTVRPVIDLRSARRVFLPGTGAAAP